MVLPVKYIDRRIIAVTKMKIIQRLGIAAIILIALASIFTGFMSGFPWEKISAAHAVKNYVVETYGFTPTKVKTEFLFDVEGRAEVATKELPFEFDVYVSRRSYVDGDDYLNSLVEYHAGKILQEDVKELLVESRTAYAHTVGILTEKNNSGFTADAVNENPNIVFEGNKIKYNFGINFEKGDGRDKTDTVCEAISKKYSPDCIYVVYYDENGNERTMSYE